MRLRHGLEARSPFASGERRPYAEGNGGRASCPSRHAGSAGRRYESKAAGGCVSDTGWKPGLRSQAVKDGHTPKATEDGHPARPAMLGVLDDAMNPRLRVDASPTRAGSPVSVRKR